MYFATVITTALFGLCITMAVPAPERESKRDTLCSGLESQPQCCALDVLDAAALQCESRTVFLSLFNVIPFPRMK